MITWADKHIKKKVDPAIDKQNKERKRINDLIYGRKSMKKRVFDEQSVLNNPDVWKDKILKVISPKLYFMYEKIFGLPEIEDKKKVKRVYSLYHCKAPLLKPGVQKNNLKSIPKSKPVESTKYGRSFAYKPSKDNLFSQLLPHVINEFAQAQENIIQTSKTRGTLSKSESTEEECDSDKDCMDDMYVNPPTRPPTPPKDILKDQRSAYQLFLTKTDDEVASTWRKPADPITISEMNWQQRGNAATEIIAREFVKWIKETAGFTNTTIDEAKLKEMFRVDWTSAAERSITIDLKELASVPEQIAAKYHEPEAGERSALHRQVIWDTLYEQIPERKIGFGRLIPNPHIKWKKRTKDTWFPANIIPPDLQSGALLWRDLFETDVLDNFCKWLLENPQYDRPKYLVNTGYINQIAERLRVEGDSRTFQQMAEERKVELRNKINKDELWARNANLASRVRQLVLDESLFQEAFKDDKICNPSESVMAEQVTDIPQPGEYYIPCEESCEKH